MRQRAAETDSRLTAQSLPYVETPNPFGLGVSAGIRGPPDRRRLDYFSVSSRPSFGAPVPDEPTNSFLPSGNVMSRPLARFEPSLAWKPSTMISVPSGSDFLFQPRRSRAFGAPPSTIQRSTLPSSRFTSM